LIIMFASSPPPPLTQHALRLGIPRSALPPAPGPAAGADEIRAARQALEGLLASFLSAGL